MLKKYNMSIADFQNTFVLEVEDCGQSGRYPSARWYIAKDTSLSGRVFGNVWDFEEEGYLLVDFDPSEV